MSGYTLYGRTKLLIALRYYAVGSGIQAIGDIFGVSETTARNTIEEVSFLIGFRMKDRYIRMPLTDEEIRDAQFGFYQIAKFPLCICCTDGTHIKIRSPGGEYAEHFRNRKLYFSINSQMTTSYDVSNFICYIKLFQKCPNKINSLLSIFTVKNSGCGVQVGRIFS